VQIWRTVRSKWSRLFVATSSIFSAVGNVLWTLVEVQHSCSVVLDHPATCPSVTVPWCGCGRPTIVPTYTSEVMSPRTLHIRRYSFPYQRHARLAIVAPHGTSQLCCNTSLTTTVQQTSSTMTLTVVLVWGCLVRIIWLLIVAAILHGYCTV